MRVKQVQWNANHVAVLKSQRHGEATLRKLVGDGITGIQITTTIISKPHSHVDIRHKASCRTGPRCVLFDRLGHMTTKASKDVSATSSWRNDYIFGVLWL